MKIKEIACPDFSVPAAQPYFIRNGAHAVLLLHGFTDCAARMRPVGSQLAAEGFTVKGINLPGHAATPAAMARTGWRDWLDASREALLSLKREYDTVSVAGLSMGGVLSLLLAEEGLPDACVTVSAPMGVKSRLMPFAGVLAPFVQAVGWGPADPAQAVLVDAAYDLRYGGFPTRCAASLAKLIRTARKGLKKVACPVLTVQSRADAVISADSADVILNGVSSAKKEALWLERVPHAASISIESVHIGHSAAVFLGSVRKP